MHRRLWLCALSVIVANCSPDEEDEQLPVISVVEAVTDSNGGGYNGGGYNGGGYNGGGYNGGGYNGGGYNGGGYNGGGYNGGGYNGGGYNGGGYNGGAIAGAYTLAGFGMNGSAKNANVSGSNVGLNGTSVQMYSGLGWNYNESTSIGSRKGMGLSTSTVNSASLLGLHDWISHTDANGYQGPTGGTSTSLHYCAGKETESDTFLSNATVPAGAALSFQRSSGGGVHTFTLSGSSAALELHIRINAPPVVGSGSSVNNCVRTAGTSKYCILAMNPGDTAFIKVYNNSASSVTGAYAMAAGVSSNACDDTQDIDARMNALEYLVRCMCPSSVSINFSTADTHLATSSTLTGQFNLAPTWCTGATSAAVPELEVSAVSACYMAHLNELGTHVGISLRGSTGNQVTNPSLNPTTPGELLMNAISIASFFGNFFTAGKGCRGVGETTTGTVAGLTRQLECCSGATDAANQCVHVDGKLDGPSYDQHWEYNSTTGMWWFNSMRFVLQAGEKYDPYYSINHWVRTLGRTCDIDGCGRMTVVGKGDWTEPGGPMGLWTTNTSQNTMFNSATLDGKYTFEYSNVNQFQYSGTGLGRCYAATSTPQGGPSGVCGDASHPITGGGALFRPMSVYIGLMTNLRGNDAAFTPTPPNQYMQPAADDYWSFSRLISGSAPLTAGQDIACQSGTDGYSNCVEGNRLTGLLSAQTIESIFQVYPTTKVQQSTLPINYAEPYSVAIRYSTPTAPASFRVYVKKDPSSSNLNYTAYQVTPTATGGGESYRTLYVYPVYMKQETVGSLTNPQVRVKVSGPSNGNPAADLDSVQVLAGQPPCSPDTNGFCSTPS